MNYKLNKTGPGVLILSAVLAAILLSVFLGSCENALMEAVERDVAGFATYSVAYKGNGATGGEVPVDLTEYKSGETVTVLGIGTLEKDEYEFLHWNTQADDNGTSYVAGPTLVMGGSDVTLWAIWTKLPTYTVTFNSQGGSAVDEQTVIEGGLVVEPADPTRAGYTFEGWFKESLCNNSWNFFSDTVTENTTIYADWEARTYTVSFDERGGEASSPASKVVTYGEAYGTLPTTSKHNYIFEGWWTGANGTGSQVTEITTVSTASNHTLYARWGWYEYELGDLASSIANSWVFYINPDAYEDGWKYLMAATGDLTSRAWGTYNYTVSGADGTAIDTGEQNTIDIVSGDPLANKAADECADYSYYYSGYTYDDYYLPSKDELDILYQVLGYKDGGFLDDTTYWCSSEASATTAWAQDFTDGTQTTASKSEVYAVRPIMKY